MPGMDGLALADAIRAQAPAGTLPILILSSIGERMPPDAPISGSLTKPVKPSPLHDALVNVLAGRQAASPSRAPERPAIDTSLATRHPLRLLLAEDNAVNQKLALRLLERMGYRGRRGGRRAAGDRRPGRHGLRRGPHGRPDARARWPRGDPPDPGALARARGRASSR